MAHLAQGVWPRGKGRDLKCIMQKIYQTAQAPVINNGPWALPNNPKQRGVTRCEQNNQCKTEEEISHRELDAHP